MGCLGKAGFDIGAHGCCQKHISRPPTSVVFTQHLPDVKVLADAEAEAESESHAESVADTE